MIDYIISIIRNIVNPWVNTVMRVATDTRMFDVAMWGKLRGIKYLEMILEGIYILCHISNKVSVQPTASMVHVDDYDAMTEECSSSMVAGQKRC
ncbi:hypothetical protein [Undibacterium pigrum]|uniref:Uncharacterized protein n=1 Tax=Undibacterium pigrum TaxID=401470 RepID=A0A318J9A1_9BURK|nr:hypothetical protein [Undibacterium pigrum]PXX44270.1 hypothetical protein DFR42_103540 [Undibacterium pigrum]